MTSAYSRYYYFISTLVLVVICAFYTWPLHLSSDLIAPICIISILSLGVIHGSNDISTIRVTMKSQKFSFKTKVLLYVLSATIFIVLFLTDKRLMLLAFIGISAYHFGEERALAIKGLEGTVNTIWSIAFGSFILLTLFYFNFEEFRQVVSHFGFGHLHQNTIGQLLVPCLIIQSILLFGNLVLGKVSITTVLLVVIELTVVVVLFRAADLLFGFTVYFIFWHSIPSIYSQIKTRKRFDADFNLSSFIVESLPVYGLSLFFAITTLYLFYHSIISMKFLLTAISCITLPHILTMALNFKK